MNIRSNRLREPYYTTFPVAWPSVSWPSEAVRLVTKKPETVPARTSAALDVLIPRTLGIGDVATDPKSCPTVRIVREETRSIVCWNRAVKLPS